MHYAEVGPLELAVESTADDRGNAPVFLAGELGEAFSLFVVNPRTNELALAVPLSNLSHLQLLVGLQTQYYTLWMMQFEAYASGRDATGLGDAFFSEPRRRSWPGEPTRLEVLATRAQLSDSELRALLHHEIQRRLRQRGEAWEKLDHKLEMREKRSVNGSSARVSS